MLLAGWEVRMVKPVTEFAGGGQPFQARGHSFSLNGPNPLKSPVNGSLSVFSV